MFSRRAASEFPNDNPELHDGLVWQSDSLTGHALPTLRLRQLAGSMPKVIGPAWEQRAKRLSPPVEPAVATALEPARVTSRSGVPEVLVQAPVADAAVPECVAVPEPAVAAGPFVESLSQESEPEIAVTAHDVASAPSAFDALTAALVRVALDRGATRVAAELPALLSGAARADSPREKALVALGPAWRAALEGGDLAGCGDQPLDVWASELLAVLLSAPSEREALRRALRRHGVAAFGMLAAA
jgi:hypothetical protein